MLKKERSYQFRERMFEVHPFKNRDYSITRADDEIMFEDGIVIGIPLNSSEVIITAARDFCDFLFDSMNISARVAKTDKGNIKIQIDLSYGSYKSFKVTVDNVDITITAHDERGAAQALFYLEDEMTAKEAPILKYGIIERTPLFSPRMCHSGYMLDEFPDSYLAQIAHAGMDAILVMTRGDNESLHGHTDFNDLIRRAAKWGLDVYAYSYFNCRSCHPTDPAAEAYYDSKYGNLFRKCPGFKGIILVGEIIGFPTHDPNASPRPCDQNYINGIPSSKPSVDLWPCKDYSDLVKLIQRIIYKYNPNADIVFWSYNWGYADIDARLELIRLLPKDISLLVTFETFELIKYDEDVYEEIFDYTLSFAGPGQYFISEAKAAKECGLRLYAMTNTGGNTWDMGGIPYQPMPGQWRERAAAVIRCKHEYGILGIMEGHQYGFTPSIISEMVKYMYDTGDTDTNKELVRIIRRHFGNGHEEEIINALSFWDEAIREMPPSGEEQSNAFRVGPSYPFSIAGKYMYPGNNGFMTSSYRVYNGLHPSSPDTSGVRMPYQRAKLQKMLSLLAKGRTRLEALKDTNEEFEYLVNLGHFMECIVTTGINSKDWYIVVSKLPIVSDRAEVEQLILECERILAVERANVKRAIDIVEHDSRLGWDPRMEYVCDPERLYWKIQLLDYVAETELDRFRIPNRWADKMGKTRNCHI